MTGSYGGANGGAPVGYRRPVSTIGVALAIPEPWARELLDYRTSLGDATAEHIPTHITLIPPTEVDDEDLETFQRHLEWVAGDREPFVVHLRGTGTFRPVSPVVFVMLAQGISDCEQLAAALRSGPIDIDLAFPYHPHVTVAHHLADPVLDRAFTELAGFECRWEATGFHLYVHDDDDGWTPTRSFSLQRGAVEPR